MLWDWASGEPLSVGLAVRSAWLVLELPTKIFPHTKEAGRLCVRPVTPAGLFITGTEARHLLAESNIANQGQQHSVVFHSELRSGQLADLPLRQGPSFDFLRIASLTPNQSNRICTD